MKLNFNDIKPMLAEDYVETKLKFPLGLQPKIDGVRSLYLNDRFTGRSMKGHRNDHVNSVFNNYLYKGLDGEMASLHETHPDLCRITSGDLSRIKGLPRVTWHCFDYITHDTIKLVYLERYKRLSERLQEIKELDETAHSYLKLVPMVVINDVDQLRKQDSHNLDLGYEGSIIRDLDGLYREGRSTITEGGLLRIKHFIEEDAIVLDIYEGNVNNNEAVTNPLGRTERSSSKAGLSSNGMIGSMLCLDIKTQKEITVGAGSMTHAMRKYYFENPHLIKGEVIKYKWFPKGVFNKPRFPTFQSFRIKSDMV